MHQSTTALFHVSETGGIDCFTPRIIDGQVEPLVWAIDDEHLRNYLVPRDCPRVTYAAGSATTTADIRRFLGSSHAVFATESAWGRQLPSARLYCYQMPDETFALSDRSAGYFVSRVSVVPLGVRAVTNGPAELFDRGVELRLLPSVWPLHDAVVRSTLEYSMIRMRNARVRASAHLRGVDQACLAAEATAERRR